MAQIKCIYGAPCSGKSTFVKENAGEGDIIWDFDHIRAALTNHEEHDTGTDGQNDMTKQLRFTFANGAKDNAAEVAWFICTRPTDKIRELLGEDAEFIEMEATEQECLDRLEKDKTRKNKKLMKKLIHEYFNGEEKSKNDVFERRGTAMKKGEKEIRNVVCEIRMERREDGDSFTIVGKPIVFNRSTDIGGYFSEEIAPEAVRPEILRDVCLLVNHDMTGIPLARSRRNNENSNLRFYIEPEDVSMEADLSRKNPKALELESALERKDITGMSFAFYVEDDEWTKLDSSYPHRRITKFSDILEVSAVNWPAYPQTSIGARALESAQSTLKEAREALESATAKQKKIAELNKRLN